MKKSNLLLVFIFILSVFTLTNVSAKEIYFTNDNGVSLDIDEYEYFVKLYGSNYLNILTQEKYDMLSELGLIDKNKVVTKTKYDFGTYSTQGTFHQTSSKRITIGKICTNGNCNIVTSVEWFVSPNVRSYDVMGSYYFGTSRLSNPTTVAMDTSTSNYALRTKSTLNGFGQTFKLPSGNPIDIVQDHVVNYNAGATVSATYQHATRNISLNNSQSYNIDFGGYGGVLYFYGAAYGVYDGMAGVEITL